MFTIRDLDDNTATGKVSTHDTLLEAVEAAKTYMRRTQMDPGWGIEATEHMYVPAGSDQHVDAIVLRPVSYGEPHETGVVIVPE